MKHIKAIGFDMDHTLVEYHTEDFENLVHQESLKKLVTNLKYPKELLKLKFDARRVIQGLVIDKAKGNILKLSRFGKVKQAYHGLQELSFKEMQKEYRTMVIDLSDPSYQSLDTAFSISNGVLYLQLVELKSKERIDHSFEKIATDIKYVIDLCHRDGTLKSEVQSHVEKYIRPNPKIPECLENLKANGKLLLLITNSEYAYSKTLMEFAFDPYLKNHKSWMELFDVSLTLCKKPRFFTERQSFLQIDSSNGSMKNYEGDDYNGLFQGGNANDLQNFLGLEGEEILYLGDHIFGDVVSIKKTCGWRTALVCYPIEDEVLAVKKSNTKQEKIDLLMKEKINLESNYKVNAQKIDAINNEISDLIVDIQKNYNPFWGELMRAGAEESRFADQLEKYACVYMKSVADLKEYGANFYFRPFKRSLPHEL